MKPSIKTFIGAALIVTLTSDVPDLTFHVESDRKLSLQHQEEPKLSDGLQLHLPETPCAERLIWPTVAAHYGSGIQSLSQSKTDEYELFYSSGCLSVRAKILAENPEVRLNFNDYASLKTSVSSGRA